MSIKEYSCVKGIPRILVKQARGLILKNIKTNPIRTILKLLIVLPFYYIYKALYIITLPFAIPNEFLRRLGEKNKNVY